MHKNLYVTICTLSSTKIAIPPDFIKNFPRAYFCRRKQRFYHRTISAKKKKASTSNYYTFLPLSIWLFVGTRWRRGNDTISEAFFDKFIKYSS